MLVATAVAQPYITGRVYHADAAEHISSNTGGGRQRVVASMDPQRIKNTAYLVTVRPIRGVTIRRVLFEDPDQILLFAGPTRR